MTPTARSLSEIHWLAGFLEGEGSFGWNRTCAVIQAVQVQRWPVDLCKRITGGGIHVLYRKSKYPRQNDAWRWQLSGIKAVEWMMTLYVLLSPKRQAQIRVALGRWRKTRPRKIDRTHCPAGHPYVRGNLLPVDVGRKTHRKCKECHRLLMARVRHAGMEKALKNQLILGV